MIIMNRVLTLLEFLAVNVRKHLCLLIKIDIFGLFLLVFKLIDNLIEFGILWNILYFLFSNIAFKCNANSDFKTTSYAYKMITFLDKKNIVGVEWKMFIYLNKKASH